MRLLTLCVVAIGCAACHGSSGSSAGSSSASTTTNPATTTASTTTPAVSTSTTTGAGTTATTVVAPPPGIARCTTANLRVTLPGASGAAGTEYYQISFGNNASTACEMTGYPGVSFLDASRAQIGVPAQRTGSTFSPVIIVGHGSGYAVLAVGDPDVRACPTATARYVRIFPPNNTVPALITVNSTNASGTTNGIRVCAQQTPPATIAPVLGHS